MEKLFYAVVICGGIYLTIVTGGVLLVIAGVVGVLWLIKFALENWGYLIVRNGNAAREAEAANTSAASDEAPPVT